MRSSDNTYLSNLDHLRAFAAYLVFIWHFVHYPATGHYPVHIPGLSLLEQGYSGVSLFMCISGYIFTYLTYDKRLHIGKFWLNRILRLFPLIIFWGICESAGEFDLYRLLHPQGAWTIYIELEYYLALPILLACIRVLGVNVLLLFLLGLIGHRAVVWYTEGSVQEMAYWTIWGHADQFLLGTAAFYLEQHLKRTQAHPGRIMGWFAVAGLAGIVALYHYIALRGGYVEQGGPLLDSSLWIVLPTIEGLCYSCIVISYLQLPVPEHLSRPLSAMGRWSYSIYLDHFQLVPFLYIFAVTRFHMGNTFYSRVSIATFIIFPLIVLFSALTYQMIEKPFLKLRRHYLSPPDGGVR